MDTETATSRGSLARLAFAGALPIFLLFLLLTGSASAAPRPAWSIEVTSFPTNFPAGEAPQPESGPYVYVLASNVGGAKTSGPYVFSETLPSDLVPKSNPAWRIYQYGNPQFDQDFGEFSEERPSCSLAGQTLTCKGKLPISPGEGLSVKLPVEALASATGNVPVEATIEGGGAAPASGGVPITISSERALFGFTPQPSGAFGVLTNPDGTPATQAGSHPEQLEVAMNFNHFADPEHFSGTVSGNGMRDIVANLPRGMVINPDATPTKCTEAQLEAGEAEECPDSSQIGLIRITWSISGTPNTFVHPLYNMVPPAGRPAEFGFEFLEGLYLHLLGRVRSNGDYGLSSDSDELPAKALVSGVSAILWGQPSAASHDSLRGACLRVFAKKTSCPSSVPSNVAALTMPSDCPGTPTTTTLESDSWDEPGVFKSAVFDSQDTARNPVAVSGCNQLQFAPTITAHPTTNLADSPSGLEFNLHQPQNLDFGGLSTANLKDTVVRLPEGVTLNPSAAAGLGACTEAQLDAQSTAPASCPQSSKLGTVTVKTPLVDHPLPGTVYLAKPYANPFGTLLAIYITVADPETGVVAKLPGRVDADAGTGRLTTTVTESPELPLEDVSLDLFGGARGPLRTPSVCKTYTTTSTLTPWSTPEGADATPTDSFATSVEPSGGSCPTSTGQEGLQPAFSAGTISPQAGRYTPFVLKLSREDGSQPLAGIDTVLPRGLTGKLAGIPYCSEAQIAAAVARERPNEGAAELTSPSCPAASEVGDVVVGAGAGPTPYYVHGHAYLAGPYKGAPLSMVTIIPAVAGPFDLGAVVVRVAFRVDPESAQIHAVSDPFPQIIQGIPVDLRSLELTLGRPEFTINPTNCDPSAISGSVVSGLGQSASLSSPFQVGGCSTLPFKPRISLRLKGATKRTGHPALTAVATAKPGEANIGRVAVTLPKSAFLDQAHIGTVCTRVQFAQGSTPGEKCPPRSIYGKATAITPLLSDPLSGPVFLRSSSHELPDLVVALHGQVDVVVAGRVDSVKGALRNTFEAVPDAPISKFVLQMQGGSKGLIVNSTNLCRQTSRANVLMDGQNGKVNDFKPVVKTSCKSGKRAPGKHAHR